MYASGCERDCTHAHLTLYYFLLEGETLLHSIIQEKKEKAAMFLAEQKADLNIPNKKVTFLQNHCMYIVKDVQ